MVTDRVIPGKYHVEGSERFPAMGIFSFHFRCNSVNNFKTVDLEARCEGIKSEKIFNVLEDARLCMFQLMTSEVCEHF